MILQALVGYYERMAKKGKSDVAQEGFQKQEIPFVIVLTHRGTFAGILDTREGEGRNRRAKLVTVPKGVKRAVNVEANLLWDNSAYVLGLPKLDKKKSLKKVQKRAKAQHAAFIEKIKGLTSDALKDPGIKAVINFLEQGEFSKLEKDPLWKEVMESGGNITFKLKEDTELICQRENVVKAIEQAILTDQGEKQDCLISGKEEVPARLHDAIKGVWGGQPTGTNIVSFNLPAFSSFNKAQGYNAPVGRKSMFAYTTALNMLLAKDSKQRLQVGDASTVFWSAKETRMEKIFADFFGKTETEEHEDTDAIKTLYAAPQTGARPLDEDLTPFFVLGLAPNASRIAVRFWCAGTVAETAKNIRRYFDDCEIAHGPKQPKHLPLFRLLVSTAVERKAENIQPNLAGEVMRSVLAGIPYPRTLLLAAVRRNRAEQTVTYERASLIKAVLARDARYRKKAKEAGMSLDRENRNTGYLLGRLFAVLEHAQEWANPGINATIRERFYGAASSTPVIAFPHLLKLKNHHIAKLENKGSAVYLEKEIGGIMTGLSDFPAHLDLTDQGRFAVGYYHQRQDFYTKKDQNQ